MRLQDDRLLVFGDSNVAMFKSLYDADKAILGYQHVDFWYQTGSAFNTVSIKEGIVSSRARGALPPINLDTYAHILWAGGRIRVMGPFESLLSAAPGCFSRNFIEASLREYLHTLPSLRILHALRQNFSKVITVVTTPLRGAENNVEGVEEHQETMHQYERIWQIYAAVINELGAVLIPIPPDMIRCGFLVSDQYSLARGDDLHKNLDYARAILAAAR
ncbi:hypothetical protein JWJ88_04740 [Paracoccus methylovorus]|uniref:SGNH/GDSL hydrolase family protein n=1 Tax=Paracoccus methylovorus TaxID=2812658 RepID=A0ABX7JIA3_9RHOB|nr:MULTISPECIES: hypothetical protein [Paracoccus]QRZ13973.1 hypothetical protein JWJ88_04740 [Paracoccus methylovorus]